MATDIWNGTGDWNSTPGDWSLLQPPTASDAAEIQSGNPCTISTSGVAQSLAIDAFLVLDPNASLSVTGSVSVNDEIWLSDYNSVSIGGNLTIAPAAWDQEGEAIGNAPSNNTVSVGGNVTNSGTWVVGWDTVSIAGTLVNYGSIYLPNGPLLPVPTTTTVKATSLANYGVLSLEGDSGFSYTGFGYVKHKTSLIISGAARSTLTGSVKVAGDATLEFGKGGVKTIGAGASLELYGASAQILTDGGSASALSGLTANDGTLTLVGNSLLGTLAAGGVTLTTTKAFANYGQVVVDPSSATLGFESTGGSSVTFGGILINDGSFDIGNAGLGDATTVTADRLNNSGSLDLVGNAGHAPAELLVNRSATTTGSITIGAGAEIDVGGSFTQVAGATEVEGSLAASRFNVEGGLLDFGNAITSGDGVGKLDIYAKGTLEFDASVDGTHSVDFAGPAGGTLNLGDAGAFGATIKGFYPGDAIDLLGQNITGLAYSGSRTSGVLTVTGSTGTIAELSFAGHFTTSSFSFGSDGHGGSDILHT